MAKTKISEFSATPGNNTDIDSINIAEGCAPSGINDAIRELMAQLKDFQTGAVGDSFNGPVGTTTAAAGAFTTLAASSTVTLSGGTANGVTYLNGSKVLTSGSALVFDGSNLGVGVAPSINSLSGSGYRGFEIGTAVGTGLFGGGNELYAQTNLYYNSGFKYANTGVPVAQYLQSAGVHYWYNAPSGTAGAAVTRTQAMALDTGGNLGLGVSTSAWDSIIKVLELKNSAYIGGQTDTTPAFYAGANAFYSGGGWKYKTTNSATNYISSAGSHLWYNAPSGTAGNAITFTQAMTLGASGKLLTGITTAPSGGIYIAALGGMQAHNTGNGGYASTAIAGGGQTFFTYTGAMGSETYTERARIDSSGNLLVGATSSAGTGHTFAGGTLPFYVINNSAGPSGQVFTSFRRSGAEIGYIAQNGTTAVSYSTTSDYRLKENIAPMTGALAKVAALKPVTYTWKADGSDGQGFIAHELAEVEPGCVVGEKDAVNEDGSIKPQGIDTSFLVATLAAALQEAHGLIKELQADVAALKAAA